MKKLLVPVLLLLACTAPAGLHAKDFEGTIQMTMTDGRNKAMPLAYSIKGHQIRTDIQTGGMNATAILDFKKMEMIMLMPGQPMYMVMPLEQAAEAASGHKPDDVKLEKTGVTETIIGYTCTKYVVTSKDGVTELWATEELGSFRGLGSSMGGGMGKAPPAVAQAPELLPQSGACCARLYLGGVAGGHCHHGHHGVHVVAGTGRYVPG